MAWCGWLIVYDEETRNHDVYGYDMTKKVYCVDCGCFVGVE